MLLYNEKATLFGECKSNLSIFAFGGEAHGVTIKNTLYEASDASLTPDFPLGVSNSFTKGECEIEVKSGVLLVMRET